MSDHYNVLISSYTAPTDLYIKWTGYLSSNANTPEVCSTAVNIYRYKELKITKVTKTKVNKTI